MPEHRDGTPAAYRHLESFLWHDFDAGPGAWRDWLAHRGLAANGVDAPASLVTALQLHAALRALQAFNASPREAATEAGAARGGLNRLVALHGVHPCVDGEGEVRLVPADTADPGALLLTEALEAMRLGLWRRFKLCREPTCRASFFDASKPAGKIWCDMASCGSRNKMRQYRARR